MKWLIERTLWANYLSVYLRCLVDSLSTYFGLALVAIELAIQSHISALHSVA